MRAAGGPTRTRAAAVADVFVRYTSADPDWAHCIAKELEAPGRVAHVPEWEIARGDDIRAWMERRRDAAENVLRVVSDEYLKAVCGQRQSQRSHRPHR